jgi:methylthioribose-1-phosphate isomerase
MERRIATITGEPVGELLDEARRIHAEDLAANHRMGEHGAALIHAGDSVLTYCNTGALATGGYGTALGVIRSAWRERKLSRVYAGETRPWLQGAA